MRTKTATLTTLAVIPLVVALLTACSSAATSSDTDAPTPGAKSTITDATEWQLAYAKCMRSEGVDMADPGPDGSLSTTVTTDQDAYSAASKTCVAKIGEAPTAPGEKKQSKQEALARQLKVAQCFREHGVDMEDPTEDRASGIPGDAPNDVITACLGEGAQGATQMGSSN